MSFNNRKKQIQKALDIAFQYSQIDGAHHKAWAIDQMVKALHPSKSSYDRWVKNACLEDGDPNAYGWDEGITP